MGSAISPDSAGKLPSIQKYPPRLPQNGRLAFRARYLVSLADEKPARGKELFRPLSIVDDGLLVIEKGHISFAGKVSQRLLRDHVVHDLGDNCIIPPLVNAHTHLQLSWLDGQCLFHKDFTSWLQDMIPRLLGILGDKSSASVEKRQKKLKEVFADLADSGTAFVGDVGGSIAGEMTRIHDLAQATGVGLLHFCEWFGFQEREGTEIWPRRSRAELAQGDLRDSCVPSGHALYSTAPEILVRIKRWCRARGKLFNMHLAESEEENQLLLDGTGSLYDLYRDMVLPQGWRAYKNRPYALAKKLGLVDRDSLFVHGVWLDAEEIEDLARQDAAMCLCPRSNLNLATGMAPVEKYMEKGARLCLGTDGLTSNSDLNVLNEALFLRDAHGLPFSALLRMLTINGADALHIPDGARLKPGNIGRFALVPAEFF